jgi:hypothetical protein
VKRSFLALGIVGVLFVLFGSVFALQGDGLIGGSVMTGNPFWIYAGAGIACVGLIMAAMGFYLGSKAKKASTTGTKESPSESKDTASPGSSGQL